MSFAFFIRVLNDKKPGFRESENAEYHLRRVCAPLGIEVRSAANFSSTGRITDIVRDAIEQCDVVFADVSAPNENVWYEVGYADRVNEKKVVIICRSGVPLPFDRAHSKTFFFDPDDHRKTEEVFDGVRVAVEEIISVSAIYRLITGDQPDQSIPEYIQNKPHIAAQCIATLRDIAKDVERQSEVRRRAVLVLSRIGEIDDESLIQLTRRLTEATVRTEIFELIGRIATPVPRAVWENAREVQLSIPVMRAAARAGSRQFVSGLLPLDLAVSIFAQHPRWEPRKHFLLGILENSAQISKDDLVTVCRELFDDDRDEVSNRFKEWMSGIEDASKLTEAQIALLKALSNDHTRGEIREKASILLAKA